MPGLPSGTVTFLFTDIEGSTKLWELHPQAMAAALSRHDELLRQIIQSSNGYVFKTIGDAFCAAFPTASSALAAAVTAQLALHSEPWQEALQIDVRMSLHSGAAELRDSDYFGQSLNRVARLLSAGHGGQILLSLATQELTRDALPPDTSLLDMGTHSLRDLSRPERVFQLLHPALPADFPPLKSLDNPSFPNNLPRQLTSFIGREKEIADVTALLGKSRLLTLTGAGGSGKTRLSLQVAVEILEDYPDGVWQVELAALSDPALVPQMVASVMGIKERIGQSLTDTLAEYLKSKRTLILLDNCEHLLDACGKLATTLLRVCPDLRILATSREALGTAGEQAYRIPSLSLPDPAQTATVESVGLYEAVRLFVERAMLVKPDFVVTNANAPALAQLCFHLDGIPLAIELAAARVRSLSVEDINGKLDNRFRLLTGGSRSALPRQQTLRALIDWSYDLLDNQEKLLLTRLSIFAGGWTLPAAEQVATGEGSGVESLDEWEILDVLSSLVDKSLVLAEARAGSTRYRMLETIRQYADERLHTDGEKETIQSRHRNWCLSLVRTIENKLRGPQQADMLDTLETEHPNFRATLEGATETALERRKQLQIASALQYFWYLRGHLAEGRLRLGNVLALTDDAPITSERANALRGAGRLARNQGELGTAHAFLEEALSVYRELKDQTGIADILMDLGNAAYEMSNYALADTLWEEGLSIHTRLQNLSSMAHAHHVLGIGAERRHDRVTARRQHETSLAIHRSLGDRIGTSLVLQSIAGIAHSEGDLATSRSLLEECLMIHRELGLRVRVAESLLSLSTTRFDQAAIEEAYALLGESYEIFSALGDRWGIAETLYQRGEMSVHAGDFRNALLHFKANLQLCTEIGNQKGILDGLEAIGTLVDPHDAVLLMGAGQHIRESISTSRSAEEQLDFETQQAQLRTLLGSEAFEAAWAQSNEMPLEQVIVRTLATKCKVV